MADAQCLGAVALLNFHKLLLKLHQLFFEISLRLVCQHRIAELLGELTPLSLESIALLFHLGKFLLPVLILLRKECFIPIVIRMVPHKKHQINRTELHCGTGRGACSEDKRENYCFHILN